MNGFLLLAIVAFQLGHCPAKWDTTSINLPAPQNRPEMKPKLTFVFATLSSEEPYARITVVMRSNGSLFLPKRNMKLFDSKAEASERESQLLGMRSCLKKSNDGIYRLDIYVDNPDTSYQTVVRTLDQLKTVIEPVLLGDAVICIRPYGIVK